MRRKKASEERAPLERLPLAPDEGIYSNVSQKTYPIKGNYFFDLKDTPSRAFLITLTAQALYDRGASLINENAEHQATALLTQYNHLHLANLTMRIGALSMKDTVQAAFVIKVALDYLEPQEITKLYFYLYQHVGYMGSDLSVSFPDKSQLPLAALFDLVNSYILNHSERFQGFNYNINFAHAKEYESFWQHRYIIGVESAENKHYKKLQAEFQK